MHTEVVAVKDLHFAYNGNEVLHAIDFVAVAGDYIGLVGPNGSGKSTLIRTILGLEVPQRGSVRLFGQDVRHFDEWGRIGYLPQNTTGVNRFFPATVKEIVALGLVSRKRAKDAAKADSESVLRVMDFLDIIDIKNKLIGELSGGQQQRVFLARALVNEPQLLILDEPTVAIDPEIREKFFTILDALNGEKKMTILLITHDSGNIGKHAHKLLYLDKRVIFYGSFEDFCESSEMTQVFGSFSQHIICHRHN